MTDWPRVFHRIWLDEPESPRFSAWRDRLAELHPGWEIRTWGDSGELDWLRNQELFDRYLPTDPYGRVPDILRYELLWRFGGVYIDTDFEPLRPIDELLEDGRPFAAWENDRTMCTAILGAPPGHPAVDALIEGLAENCRRFERKPPNYATGPEYATRVWRGRDDVKRLPPISFYPVGWWEKERLGGAYPEETFAVHHWAKGWGDDAPPKPATGGEDAGEPGRVVLLVPWRPAEGEPDREAGWAIARAHLERTGWPIYVGDPGEGPWNRSRAINRAAAEAGDWDVAVICDADTVHADGLLREAAALAWRQSAAVVAFDQRWKMNRRATEKFARLGPAAFDKRKDRDAADPTRIKGVPAAKRGGTIAVSRAAWDAAAGFDEGFEGWGFEDRAFRAAAGTLAPGGLLEVRGTCWHVWHPLTQRKDVAARKANGDRFRQYVECDGSPATMASLLRELGVGE